MTVGGEAYAIDAELAMKGNIKTADVVTVSVKAPALAGFAPKATYSTGPKGLSLVLAGDVAGGDTNVELKAEHFPKKAGAPTALTAAVTQKLPEKIKAKLTLKDDLSGSVELHKGAAIRRGAAREGWEKAGRRRRRLQVQKVLRVRPVRTPTFVDVPMRYLKSRRDSEALRARNCPVRG